MTLLILLELWWKEQRHLYRRGAKEIYACATHPVFSGPAFTRIENSCLQEVVVTNTIKVDQEGLSQQGANKIKVLSVAPVFAEAIKRIHGESSVSDLLYEKVR